MKFVIAILQLVLLFLGSIPQTTSLVTKPRLPTVVQCDLLNNAALYGVFSVSCLNRVKPLPKSAH